MARGRRLGAPSGDEPRQVLWFLVGHGGSGLVHGPLGPAIGEVARQAGCEGRGERHQVLLLDAAVDVEDAIGRCPRLDLLDRDRVIEGPDLAAFARSLGDDPEERASHSSARNRLRGIVTAVRRDSVMAQVDIQAGPYRLVSLMLSLIHI